MKDKSAKKKKKKKSAVNGLKVIKDCDNYFWFLWVNVGYCISDAK